MSSTIFTAQKFMVPSYLHPSWMEFHKCSANAVGLQSNHRVTMHGDDEQIGESVRGHCPSQSGVESAETGE